jgi:hypothetical protein
LRTSVINEKRRLLEEHRRSQRTIHNYEAATGKSKNQLIREATEAEGRHLLKVNGTRQTLTDIAARIREAQRHMKAIEQRAKANGEDLARSLHS